MKQIFIILSIVFFGALSCEQKPLYDYFNFPPFIYVATSGNDTTGDGSQTAPYATIEHALSVADGRTDIRIAAGTYLPASPLVMKKGISLLGGYDPTTWTRAVFDPFGAPAGNVTTVRLNGAYTGTGMTNPSRTIECSGIDIDRTTIIEGLTITTNTADLYPCALFIRDGASPTIRYNTIVGGISSVGPDIYGVIAITGANPLFQNNNINAGSGTSTNAYGIEVNNAHATITGNMITADSPLSSTTMCIHLDQSAVADISDNTLRIGRSSSGTGISCAVISDSLNSRATIRSNTIDDSLVMLNLSSAIAISCNSNNAVITDNTISLTSSSVAITNSTAIQLNASQNTVIERNTITQSGLPTNKYGILLLGNCSSLIRGNIITAIDNTTTNIYDSSTGSGNIVCSNFLNASGSTPCNIYCDNSSPQIINNTIISQGYGIFIDGGTAVAIINNIISVTGATQPCVWETSSASDPAYFNNNALLSTTYLFYDADAVPPDTTTVNDVFTLSTRHPAYTNNIEPTLSINTADGSIPLADQVNINSQGYDISATYPAAMTDLDGGDARVVPLSIGAYEY